MKLIKITLLSLSFAFNLSANVQFAIDYKDAPGTGIHTRPQYKKAFEEALEELGSWLDHDAVIKIALETEYEKKGSTVASFHGRGGLVKDTVNEAWINRKIINNVLSTEENPDGTIKMYIAQLDELPLDKIPVIIKHEVTHGLGFSSRFSFAREYLCNYWIEDSDKDSWRKKYGNLYNKYDQFLTDEQGRYLFIMEESEACKYESFYSKLYFSGPYSRTVGPIPLFGDLIHLSDRDERTCGSMMNPDVLLITKNSRYWSKYEIAILKDLGYKIKPEVEVKAGKPVFVAPSEMSLNILFKENFRFELINQASTLCIEGENEVLKNEYPNFDIYQFLGRADKSTELVLMASFRGQLSQEIFRINLKKVLDQPQKIEYVANNTKYTITVKVRLEQMLEGVVLIDYDIAEEKNHHAEIDIKKHETLGISFSKVEKMTEVFFKESNMGNVPLSGQVVLKETIFQNISDQAGYVYVGSTSAFEGKLNILSGNQVVYSIDLDTIKHGQLLEFEIEGQLHAIQISCTKSFNEDIKQLVDLKILK